MHWREQRVSRFLGWQSKAAVRNLQKFVVLTVVCAVVFADFTHYAPLPAPLDILPTVPLAHAATGDFVTYEELGGSDTISGTGTVFDVTWDSTVSTNANLTLQANSSDIDLAEGGKYLVLYNTWADQGGAGGANRRSLHSFLTLAGTPLAYGRGAGYIRDSENLTTAYVNGGAIIDATAGADLQVHLQRDDTNPSGGTETLGAANGLSVIKLPDNGDYLRARVAATSSSISANTTFTDVLWDTSDEVDADSFAFTPTSADLTLKGDDGAHFLVTANVGLYVSAGGSTRQNYELRLTLDGVEIPGTRTTSYLRGTNGTWYGQLVYQGLIAKSAVGDQNLNVEIRRESTGSATTVIMGDKTAVSIFAVPDTAKVIRLTDTTGTQTTANAAQALTFNTQSEIATDTFTHSTVSNADRVDINTAGDYLFFGTAYTETTSSGSNRQPFRVNWLKTGIEESRGAFAAYNRANSSFTAGAAGAILLAGLSASDYVSLQQLDESSNAPVDATFPADRIALQGVLLDDNFYGLDLLVAASGTQATVADVPTTDLYAGGMFVLTERNQTRNITNITMSEVGTVDGANGIANIKLFYELSSAACSDVSYSGTESQFGSTDTNGFSGANGSASFSDTVTLSPGQSLCVYPVLDITSAASDGETIELEITDPHTDIAVTGGGTVGPETAQGISGATTLQNAELTQVHYHWLNDDGAEGAASSVEGAEDTPIIGLANGSINRLRLQVSAEGSTSSLPASLRLEYAQKMTTCSAASSWADVGAVGGDWDMAESSFIVDGADSSDLLVASGGTTNENTTHLSSNGALRDTTSELGALTFTSSNFLETEFAIEPTVSAPQGNTYCFRLSDAGTPLRNYTTYAEGTISADVEVSASGTQATSLAISSLDQYLGGTFVIERPGSPRAITSITLSETGTIDAAADLTNIRLFYDLDTTAPYDCTGEAYGGGEAQFGTTDTDGFSAANGTVTFTDAVNASSTEAFCGYVVLDIGSGANNGETIEVEITDPSSEVTVTSSSVGPSTAVTLPGSTSISGPVLTQTHYHWRNDDGGETDATSASGGVEDTAITEVPLESLRRVRVGVSNEGTVASGAVVYELEYGTKVTTCENVAAWTTVGSAGAAWNMAASSNISDGNTTDIASAALGAITNENTIFVGTGALRETTAQSGAITLSSTAFTELEYAIAATTDAGYDTTYCFRVTNVGTPFNTYSTYPELTTREKQDFFIQRGTLFVSGTSTTLVAGTDYTAPSASTSAFIRITNSQITGAGRSTGNQPQNADDVTAYIEDPENIETSITFARPTAAINDTRVSWEIIEYVGIPGGDNELIVRDQGAVAYGSGNTTATGSAATTVNTDGDVVVFITGQTNQNTGTGGYNQGVSTAAWATSSQAPVFTRGLSGSAGEVSYAVVEFTGANWNVQRVAHQYASVNTEQAVIAPVGSLSRTFIHVQKQVGSGETGLHDLGHEVWLSSIGALSLQLQDSPDPVATPAQHTAVVWVVENTQTGVGAMNVQRSNGALAATTPCGGVEPCAETISITTVNESNASISVTNRSTGAGTAFPRPIMGVRLLSGGSGYELWRSDTGQTQTFRTEVIEWPVAETSVRQNYYRFYVDNDDLTPTDPWPAGASNLGENTTLTGTDEPLGEGERIRIRMSLLINNATLPSNVAAFKLQYGLQNTTCSAVSVWNDVGAPGSGTIWRGFNGTPADGSALATSTPAAGTLLLSLSDVAGTYEEENNSAINPYAIDIGEDVEYDWLVEHNGAAQRSDYCFRMVYSDDTELDGYLNYPTLRTTGYTPVVSDWRWYDDEGSVTPSVALAAENVAPTNIANQDLIKLRVVVSEVENAVGSNVKFALQYSQYADFSDGGTYVTGTSSCHESSLWCYADGAGVDNDAVTAAVLAAADACVAGVGAGCGTHNETGTTTSTHPQPAGSNMEFEYTLRQAGARANGVYYFRLVDASNEQALSASSTLPSLVTEGAQLVFTVSGLPAGTTTAGVTTDVATTPTAIGFGSLPVNTSVVAAQRIAISTNATEGYQLLAYAPQQLLNTYGDPVPAISASNAAPAGWTTACSGSAIGCFGYHSTDATLAGSSGRFGPTDSYAALEVTPREIMYSSIPTSDQHDMVYRIEITELQPAGDYETDIVYIAVPVF